MAGILFGSHIEIGELAFRKPSSEEIRVEYDNEGMPHYFARTKFLRARSKCDLERVYGCVSCVIKWLVAPRSQKPKGVEGVSVPIPEDTAYLELQGNHLARIWCGEPVEIGQLPLFKQGSVLGVQTEDDLKHVVGPVVQVIKNLPTQSGEQSQSNLIIKPGGGAGCVSPLDRLPRRSRAAAGF